MGPSVKHRPAPNQPLSMVKKSSFSGCFIPSLGLNPNSWMGQMQFVVWPKYMFIIVSQPQKTMVKDGQGRKVRLSKLIAQHDSPDM